MPHVRHGGIGNADVAFAASKFEGTGFEKEQIGQTQVPVESLGETAALGVKGLLVRVTGDDNDEGYVLGVGVEKSPERRREPTSALEALGNKVIFAEDLRNPA